ncbi:alpha/beta hydrolase [Thermosynechococcus sp. FA-CM-4201]
MSHSSPRSLPPRQLPIPAAASPQLQQALAQPLEDIIEAVIHAPTDEQGWRDFIAAVDDAQRPNLALLKAHYPVEILATEMAGVRVYQIVPPQIPEQFRHHLLLHFHGGGYTLASGELGIGEAILAAYRSQKRVLSIDYRQGPDEAFPASLEDALAVWQALIQVQAPAAIGLFGTSAGGGLLLALVCELRRLNLPLPGAIAPLTPWADLSKTSDTLFSHEYIDSTIVSYEGMLATMARRYAGSYDLQHPLVSPLYNDLQGLPPTLLISGTRDLLLSDTVRLQRKLRQAGVVVEVQLFEGMSHADYLYHWQTPESEEVFAELASFFNRYLANAPSPSQT